MLTMRSEIFINHKIIYQKQQNTSKEQFIITILEKKTIATSKIGWSLKTIIPFVYKNTVISLIKANFITACSSKKN
jgi:hypothetical protein